MWPTAQIVEFPTPSLPGLAALAAAFFGFFTLAYLVDYRRRRALERKHRDAEWKHVERLMADRRLSESERKLLRAAIDRFAPDEPLDVVMTHAGFERFVEKAMAYYHRKLPEAQAREYGVVLRDIRIQLGLDRVPIGQRIHSTREIDAGQWADVNLKNGWVRLMAEVVDEAELYMTFKGDDPVPAFPEPGKTVRCRFWREDDGRYLFDAKVLRTERTPPTIVLEHTDKFTRTQDRDHYRIRHDQSTTLGIMSAKLAADLEEARARPPITKLRGRITSLSAGGCAVVIQQAISNRMLLKILIDLPGSPGMELIAKIVGSSPISGGRYFLRLEFLDLREQEEDAIAKYVMQRQQHTLATQLQT